MLTSSLDHEDQPDHGVANKQTGSQNRNGPLTKSYVAILEQELEHGERELKRPSRGLLLSGLAAGLDIGFSVLLLSLVVSVADGQLLPVVLELLKASAYSVGFILVIFGRSELFTEHTTLAVLPVIAGRGTVAQLLRLWGLVMVANLAGAAFFAGFLSWLGPALGVVKPEALRELGLDLVHHPTPVLFASAVMAGWMMGLVSWLVTAGRDTVGQILFVWLVTGSIGFAHLHHSVVGSIEVLSSVFIGGGATWSDFFHFLAFATLGNALGGSVFVALLRYAHARAAAPNEESE